MKKFIIFLMVFTLAISSVISVNAMAGDDRYEFWDGYYYSLGVLNSDGESTTDLRDWLKNNNYDAVLTYDATYGNEYIYAFDYDAPYWSNGEYLFATDYFGARGVYLFSRQEIEVVRLTYAVSDHYWEIDETLFPDSEIEAYEPEEIPIGYPEVLENMLGYYLGSTSEVRWTTVDIPDLQRGGTFKHAATDFFPKPPTIAESLEGAQKKITQTMSILTICGVGLIALLIALPLLLKVLRKFLQR